MASSSPGPATARVGPADSHRSQASIFGSHSSLHQSSRRLEHNPEYSVNQAHGPTDIIVKEVDFNLFQKNTSSLGSMESIIDNNQKGTRFAKVKKAYGPVQDHRLALDLNKLGLASSKYHVKVDPDRIRGFNQTSLESTTRPQRSLGSFNQFYYCLKTQYNS